MHIALRQRGRSTPEAPDSAAFLYLRTSTVSHGPCPPSIALTNVGAQDGLYGWRPSSRGRSNPSPLTETLTVRHPLGLAWLFHNETRRSQVLVKRPVAPPGGQRQDSAVLARSKVPGAVRPSLACTECSVYVDRQGSGGTPVALGPLSRKSALCLGATAPLQTFGYPWLLAIQGGYGGRDNMGRWLPRPAWRRWRNRGPPRSFSCPSLLHPSFSEHHPQLRPTTRAIDD